MSFSIKCAAIYFSLLMAISGCSSSLFSHKNENDTKITNSSESSHCKQIKLENNELSVTDFKNAVHCLNQDRSLNAFEKLLDEVPNESLDALVSYLNVSFIKNTDKINYWNSIISDGFLNQLSLLVQNKNFIESLYSILDRLDENSLKSFKVLLADGDLDKNIKGTLNFIYQVSELNSFKALSNAFAKPISNPSYSLKEMTDRVLNYFKYKTNQEIEYMKPIWFGILNENLIKGYHKFLNPDFDIQIQKLNELIEYLHVEQEKNVYPKLRDVFFAFDRSLICYQDTKKTMNANMHIFSKLNQLLDENSYDQFLTSEYLKFIITGGFCNTPKEAEVFSDVLSSFSRDRNGRILRTSVEFVKALTYADVNSEIFRSLLIDSMSDKGVYNASYGLTEPIKEWLSEDKRVIENFLYLFNALTSKEVFKTWRPFLRKYLVQRNELNGRSVQDVMFKNALKMDSESFYKLILSINELSAHPKFNLNQFANEVLILLNSDTNREVLHLIDALLKNSKSNFFEIIKLASFKDSIQLFSDLVQNGKFKTLLNNIQKVLGRKSEKIEITRKETSTNSFKSIEALASTNNQKKWIKPIYKSSNFQESCGKLKLVFDYKNASSDALRSQMLAFGNCLNYEGKNQDLENIIHTLVKPIQNTSIFKFIQNISNEILYNKVSSDSFSDLLFNIQNQETLFSTFLVSTNLFDKLNQYKKSVFDDFIDFIKIQNKTITNDEYQSFGNLLSSFILNNKPENDSNETHVDSEVLNYFKKTFALSDTNQLEKLPKPAIPNIIEVRKQFSEKYYQNKIGNSELSEFSIRVEDYFKNIRNDSRKKNYLNEKEYSDIFSKIINKISSPNQNLIRALLGFIRSLNQKPYTLSYVNRWLSRASGNVRAIEYYYPGQIPGDHKPSIILVNDLDLLELIASNADFTLSNLDQIGSGLFENKDVNFAIKYFSKLAQSPDDMTQFVQEARNDIARYLKWISFPGTKIIVKDELKRRVVNLNNVLVVLNDMNDRYDNENGIQDLRLLRDLFKYTLTAIPLSKWDVYDRESSSLAVIVDLAEIGIFRMFSTGMWVETKNRGAQAVSVRKTIRLMYEFSNYQNALEIFKILLVRPNGKSIVNNLIHNLYSMQFYSDQKLNNLKTNLLATINAVNKEVNYDLFFNFIYRGLVYYEETNLELPILDNILNILSKLNLKIQTQDVYVVKKFIELLQDDKDYYLVYKWISKLLVENQASFNHFQRMLNLYLDNNENDIKILKKWISSGESDRLLEALVRSIAIQLKKSEWIIILQDVMKNSKAYSDQFEVLATPRIQTNYKELIQELSRGVIDSYP